MFVHIAELFVGIMSNFRQYHGWFCRDVVRYVSTIIVRYVSTIIARNVSTEGDFICLYMSEIYVILRREILCGCSVVVARKTSDLDSAYLQCAGVGSIPIIRSIRA